MKYLFLILFLFTTSKTQANPIISSKVLYHPVISKKMMVATQEAYATKVGLDILKSGGNAMDAAVAVGYALAVTLPKAGNLGGGGFMLYYHKKTNKVTSINFREMAPEASSETMFLDKSGNISKQKSRYDLISSGVPGSVKGLNYALKKYGTFNRKKTMTPAYLLAKQGFKVKQALYNDLVSAQSRLIKDKESSRIFYKNGKPINIGETLIQDDLAKTLKLIMNNGEDAFYKGGISKKIISMMKKHNGLISKSDLKNYTVSESSPIHGQFRGYDIFSMPPPSSGGVHLIQILNILEQYPLKELGPLSAQTIHYMSQAMKLAYSDRAKFLGDPDFSKLPTKGMTSKPYAKMLAKLIKKDQVIESQKTSSRNPFHYESPQTTHYSIVDKHGNMASVTTTLNFSFGNGKIVPGSGFFLNNEMDDFSSKPGVPNAYGLIGGKLNSIEPFKRPLSSMTPTIVLKNNKPFLVTGSPGGSRIITTVLQIILNTIVHNMNIAEATYLPRIHHQWLPDVLRIEKGLSKDTIRILEKMGHKIQVKSAMGSTQSIMLKDSFLYGSSDPRTIGSLTLGE